MRFLWVLGLATLMSAPATAAEWRGTYRLRVLQGLDTGNLQTVEHTFMPEVETSLPGNARLYARGRLRHDSQDYLEPGVPRERASRSPLSRRQFFGDRSEAELMELYVDGYVGDTFYRVGKQSIVWGEAIGLTVLDIVNPSSMREFVLQDQEARRIPLWSVSIEKPLGIWTAQFVWVPDTTYDQLPENGAPFAFSMPQTRHQKPDDPIRDSDMGLRLTTFAAGWDISLNYLHHYSDTPAYRRNHTVGGTLSNAFGDITVRAEAGYATDRYLHTTSSYAPDGFARSAELSTVFGLDFNGFQDVLISTQLFSSHLTRHHPGMLRERQQHRATALIRGDYLNNTLTGEVLLIHSLDDHDGALQLSVDYRLRSRVTLQAGMDILYGDRSGVLGQFRDQNRLMLGLEYSF